MTLAGFIPSDWLQELLPNLQIVTVDTEGPGIHDVENKEQLPWHTLTTENSRITRCELGSSKGGKTTSREGWKGVASMSIYGALALLYSGKIRFTSRPESEMQIQYCDVVLGSSVPVPSVPSLSCQ
jgi:hypothetical protein